MKFGSFRSQRYRLTWEFELRNRGDYALFKGIIESALNKIVSEFNGVNPDYLAIEKCDPPTSKINP